MKKRRQSQRKKTYCAKPEYIPRKKRKAAGRHCAEPNCTTRPSLKAPDGCRYCTPCANTKFPTKFDDMMRAAGRYCAEPNCTTRHSLKAPDGCRYCFPCANRRYPDMFPEKPVQQQKIMFEELDIMMKALGWIKISKDDTIVPGTSSLFRPDQLWGKGKDIHHLKYVAHKEIDELTYPQFWHEV